jgi:uncharacterized protein with PIN domain
MTSRIEDGFRRRFRDLLALVRPRRLDFGVELLLRRGRERAARQDIPLARGLAQVYDLTRTRVERRLASTGACSVPAPAEAGRPASEPPRFLCDASLGGLARWLRAAGYEASWSQGQGGDALVSRADEEGCVLLTSDSRVFERRAVQAGTPRARWIPTALTRHEQLAMVLRDLGLDRRAPRCMACGGELIPTPKSDVAARIPPRTARWKDEYFLCARCDRLFWQGTHWQRIDRALDRDALPGGVGSGRGRT